MKNYSLAKNILGHLLVCGSRLAVSSFFVPYGQSMSSSLRDLEQIAARCPHDFSKHSRNTVSVTLHRLKTQKLVSLSGSNKGAVWQITKRGKDHFKGVESSDALPPKDGKTRIFMFDIPEDRRRERDWLRVELLSCDYTSLQKSVFIGKRPLPAKLLKELGRRRLFAHTHVVGLEI